jgi:hypothetical protein
MREQLKKRTVYLCGAINGRTNEECIDWRERVKGLLDCPTIDPMARDFRGRERDEVGGIIENDKADIDACDFLLVNYMGPSVGTSMEILYAWERGKAVILVTSPGTVLSPWLLYHKHKLFFSLEDAAAYINNNCLLDPQSPENFGELGELVDRNKTLLKS